MPPPIDPKLLEILACPVCKTPVKHRGDDRLVAQVEARYQDCARRTGLR